MLLYLAFVLLALVTLLLSGVLLLAGTSAMDVVNFLGAAILVLGALAAGVLALRTGA